MKNKLTKKEIAFLDMLCEKWEKKQVEQNKKFLGHFYKLFRLEPPKLKSYHVIPFELLKKDFVGTKFKSVWDLFLDLTRYPIRIQLVQGTIVLIHTGATVKPMVLSIFQKGQSWTYKRYSNMFHFEAELRDRVHYAKLAPFSKILSSRPAGIITQPTSKEEYGGMDLESLTSVANEREKEILLQIISDINLPSRPYNATYNPRTKRFYVIDSA